MFPSPFCLAKSKGALRLGSFELMKAARSQSRLTTEIASNFIRLRIPQRPLRWALQASAERNLRRLRAQSISDAICVGTCDRRSPAAALQEYTYKPHNCTTDANSSESPPVPSPPAFISLKCKRSVYRKNIQKYLKMRCLISLIASSKAERSR